MPKYGPSDELPYYFDENIEWYLVPGEYLNPEFGLGQNSVSGTATFADIPADRCLPGNVPTRASEYLGFYTTLVGITNPVGGGGQPPKYTPLASFAWSTTYNGFTGGTRTLNFSPGTGGTGGVFNVFNIGVQEMPLAIRQLFIQTGAQGVSTAPYIDMNSPMTAVFLSGPQAVTGDYTGPVTVALLATDIDGPSDIASTSFSLDGAPQTNYTAPFVVSGLGRHTISFGSVDQTGNIETPRTSQSFQIAAGVVNPGFVQVCKVAGVGIVAGTPFTFDVAGTPVTVAAGIPPAGNCSALVSEPAGPVTITETIPLGVVLTSVDTNPPGSLVSGNLALGTATVTVTSGATTIVTFTDAAVLVNNNNNSPDGTYQLRYLANLDKGDSYINLSNAGTLNGFDPTGRICANVYTFDPAEELISCCACPVTPNGLNSLSAKNDLISNTLTSGVPTSITVKVLATVPGPGGICSPSTPTTATLVRGMRAWATTLHLNTSAVPAVYQQIETPFSVAELSLSELSKLTSFCAFIQANGSGFGICKSCRGGGLGAGQR